MNNEEFCIIPYNRYYNLPLNDFYKDKSCLKYKERLIR